MNTRETGKMVEKPDEPRRGLRLQFLLGKENLLPLLKSESPTNPEGDCDGRASGVAGK